MKRWGSDEAQDIIIMFYLQDISVQFLEEEQDNPIAALNKLVYIFETKFKREWVKSMTVLQLNSILSTKMIKCRVFPNEKE